MLNFDEKTLTFKDLSDDQKLDLRDELFNLVVHGIACHDSEFFRFWCEHAKIEGQQILMVMTCAYPQRAMLALI